MTKSEIIEENLDMKICLEEIEKIIKRIEYDLHENDKVLCHLQSIRYEIAKAYPMYLR